MNKEKYKDPYKRVELPKTENSFLHLDCPSCKSKITSSDININDKIAKCGSCDALFSFENEISTLAEKNEELKKPVGVDKIYFGDELELSLNQPVVPLDAALLSITPLVTLMSSLMYFKKESFVAGIVALISIVVIAFFLARIIKSRRNKIFINCFDNKFEVEWEKNKLKKPLTFFQNEIEQLYTTRTVNGVGLKVILNTSQGQVHKLVLDGMKSVIDVKYIEQELEQYYGIQNKRVSNEIR